ncbi:hypothetical protein IE992_23700 [Klebsiella pneumoniae]|uniref:Uncharacterized protein n=1 Tax=Klebsiella pneumoniae TaxID=573 RepID=A0A927DYS4_KLEPN|nr:hypothetical protein [Klebsiella pneumoniae]
MTYMTVGLPLPVIPLFVHQELGFGNTVVGVAVGIQFLATVLTRGTPDVWQTSTALNALSCRGCWPAPSAGAAWLAAALLPLPVLAEARPAAAGPLDPRVWRKPAADRKPELGDGPRWDRPVPAK